MPTKLLTIREAAAVLNESEKTTRKRITTGQIRGIQVKPRTPWRVTESALNHYIQKYTR